MIDGQDARNFVDPDATVEQEIRGVTYTLKPLRKFDEYFLQQLLVKVQGTAETLKKDADSFIDMSGKTQERIDSLIETYVDSVSHPMGWDKDKWIRAMDWWDTILVLSSLLGLASPTEEEAKNLEGGSSLQSCLKERQGEDMTVPVSTKATNAKESA